jgi:hypothetical protein
MRFLLILFFLLSFSCRSQKSFDTNRVHFDFHSTVKNKKNVLAFKHHKLFKFTASAKVAQKGLATGDFSKSIKYDFRTKFYISRRVSILIRNTSDLASIGLVIKFP